LSDPTAATGPGLPAGPRTKHKRRLSNYLLDKKLQLRYVLVVTILSGVIAGALGFMIYQQRRAASESIEQDLKVLTQKMSQDSFRDEIASDLQSDDRALIYRMALVGVLLVVILSGYLVIMTHKVAGPLFKVSMYFERMAEGRLGNVTPLRQGDMLQDFFVTFKEMHESVRARAVADAELMEKAIGKLRESGNQADYRGEARGKLVDELDALEQHLAQRKKQLA